jgi:hypothetical protein
MTADQIDSAVDASNAATCTEVGQNTFAHYRRKACRARLSAVVNAEAEASGEGGARLS